MGCLSRPRDLFLPENFPGFLGSFDKVAEQPSVLHVICLEELAHGKEPGKLASGRVEEEPEIVVGVEEIEVGKVEIVLKGQLIEEEMVEQEARVGEMVTEDVNTVVIKVE